MNMRELNNSAAEILLARESYYPATLRELYEPDHVRDYPRLQRAHDQNDEIVERIYVGRRFRNDTERLEKLFELFVANQVADRHRRKTAHL
jgi:hypothetical protein